MDAKDKIDDHLGITSVVVFQKYVIVQLGILLNDAKTSEQTCCLRYMHKAY